MQMKMGIIFIIISIKNRIAIILIIIILAIPGTPGILKSKITILFILFISMFQQRGDIVNIVAPNKGQFLHKKNDSVVVNGT